jgi:hypothetical protein
MKAPLDQSGAFFLAREGRDGAMLHDRAKVIPHPLAASLFNIRTTAVKQRLQAEKALRQRANYCCRTMKCSVF